MGKLVSIFQCLPSSSQLTWAYSYGGGSVPRKRVEAHKAFRSLRSEMTWHHFFCILLVKANHEAGPVLWGRERDPPLHGKDFKVILQGSRKGNNSVHFYKQFPTRFMFPYTTLCLSLLLLKDVLEQDDRKIKIIEPSPDSCLHL